MITHPIVNLGPRRYHKITERVDNTVVPSNLAPSEFCPLYANCNEPGPTEFLFRLRTPTPIAHMHVSIFTTSPSKLIRQNIDLRDNYHSTKSGNPGISHNFHHRNMLMLPMHFLYNTSVCNAHWFLDIEALLKLQQLQRKASDSILDHKSIFKKMMCRCCTLKRTFISPECRIHILT